MLQDFLGHFPWINLHTSGLQQLKAENVARMLLTGEFCNQAYFITLECCNAGGGG